MGRIKEGDVMFNIADFKSEIDSKGILKSNLFQVSFAPPSTLANETRTMSLRCDNAQIPGMTFATVDGTPRFGHGPVESNPYGVIYDDITLSFMVDTRGKLHKFFFDWSNSLVQHETFGQSILDNSRNVNNLYAYEVEYKDNFCTDLKIEIFEPMAEGNHNKRIMEVKAYRAYPKRIPGFNMSWMSTNEMVKLNIPFGYTDFSVKYD